MKNVKFILLAAGIVFALAFTLSCSSDGGASAFVGKWIRDDGSMSLELLKFFYEKGNCATVAQTRQALIFPQGFGGVNRSGEKEMFKWQKKRKPFRK